MALLRFYPILISLHSDWWEYELSPFVCAFWELFGLLSAGSFSGFTYILLCMHRQTLRQRLKEQFCRSSECSMKLPHLQYFVLQILPTWPPKLWSLSSQLSEITELRSIPLPLLWPGNCLQTVSWGNCSSYFSCFPSLKDHSPTLPVVHCLKAIVSYNRSFSSCLLKKKEILVGFPG